MFLPFVFTYAFYMNGRKYDDGSVNIPALTGQPATHIRPSNPCLVFSLQTETLCLKKCKDILRSILRLTFRSFVCDILFSALEFMKLNLG